MKNWLIFLFFGGRQFLQIFYMEKNLGKKKEGKKGTCYHPLMKKGRTPWQQGLSLYRLFSFYPAAVNQRLRQTSHSRNGACGPWVTSSRVWHHVRRTTYEDSRLLVMKLEVDGGAFANWIHHCTRQLVVSLCLHSASHGTSSPHWVNEASQCSPPLPGPCTTTELGGRTWVWRPWVLPACSLLEIRWQKGWQAGRRIKYPHHSLPTFLAAPFSFFSLPLAVCFFLNFMHGQHLS